MQPYLKLIRIKHWIKNAFVFFPLFFGGKFDDFPLLIITLKVFLSFCFTASSVYIINDIKDVHEDREHPLKKFRPLASGKISHSLGSVVCFLFLSIGFVLAFSVSEATLFVVAIYFLLNILYTFFLKAISIIDCVVIATGFVLRIIAGGVAIEIEVTSWIIMLTFILSLYLAFTKRRGELVNANVKYGRKSIQHYNLPFLNSTITILAAIAIVTYILYTQDEETLKRFGFKYYYVGSVFVIIGILRHLQKTIVNESTESPTDFLFTDKVLFITILLWGLFNFYVIYTQ